MEFELELELEFEFEFEFKLRLELVEYQSAEGISSTESAVAKDKGSGAMAEADFGESDFLRNTFKGDSNGLGILYKVQTKTSDKASEGQVRFASINKPQ